MSKNYPKQQLTQAVNSDFGSKTAAKIFHVPASTIRRHRHDLSLRACVGRPAYLTNEEEIYFVSILQLLPEYGFNATREIVLQLAHDYCRSLGLACRPGAKWLRLFMKKHANDIKWKREQKMERIRAKAFTEDVRVGWFSVVKDVMTKYDLFDKPHQVFNVDETGFSDKTKGEWVIVNSNRRHIFESDGGSGKNHITVLIAINAGGFILPPFVVYGGQHLMDSWCRGGPPGTSYAVTDKGWMNREMFEYWLRNSFIPSTSHLNRPLLLVMDGYTSHISLEIINLFKKNRIICLILPPHTSHGLQPLDLVLFNSVKNDWIKIMKNYFKDGNKTLRNSDFPRLLTSLFVDKSAFTASRIVSSFTRSGIWPFNEHAMKEKVVRIHNSSISTSNDGNTIPSNILISPSQSINSICNSSNNSSSLISSNNYPSLISSEESTTFNLPMPIQQITSDDDILLPLDSTSYIDLQPCSISLIAQPSPHQQTLFIEEEETNESRFDTRDKSFDNVSSTPIIAVRNVINNFLSEHDVHMSMSKSPANRIRSSRLENKVGLNITDDEYVIRKLKEKEQKQTRVRKPRLPSKKSVKCPTKTTKTKTKKCPKAAKPSKKENKENETPHDKKIAAAVQELQSVIDYTQTIIDNDSSDDEF